ncbi:MAG: hypothetical protein ING36_03455 [Burkholderiales bacterium]|jgi:hypothetical protein|nr:hypothetical protein [Burkholderiales bacterium]
MGITNVASTTQRQSGLVPTGSAKDLMPPPPVEIPLDPGKNSLSLADLNNRTNYIVHPGPNQHLALNRNILDVYNQHTNNPDGSQTLRNAYGGTITITDVSNLSFFDSPAVVPPAALPPNTPRTPQSANILPYSELGINGGGLYAVVPEDKVTDEGNVTVKVRPGVQAVVNPTGRLGQSPKPSWRTGLQINVTNGDVPKTVSPIWSDRVDMPKPDTYFWRLTGGVSTQGFDLNNAQGPFINPSWGVDGVFAFKDQSGTNNTTWRAGLNLDQNSGEVSGYVTGRTDLNHGPRIRWGMFKDDNLTTLIQYFDPNLLGTDIRFAAVVPEKIGRLNYSTEFRLGQTLPSSGNFLTYNNKIETPFIFGAGLSHVENSKDGANDTDTYTVRVGYALLNGSFWTLTGSHVVNSGKPTTTTLTAAGIINLGSEEKAQPPTGITSVGGMVESGLTSDALTGKGTGQALLPSVAWKLNPGVFSGQIAYANWGGWGNVVVKLGYNSGTGKLVIDADAAVCVGDANPNGDICDVYLQGGVGANFDPNGTSGEARIGVGVPFGDNILNLKVHIPLDGRDPKVTAGFTIKN